VLAGQRPHVILIVIDTLRADVLLAGRNLVATPNIDALAAEGTVFPQAFTHAPMTLPAHTSLFSSRLPCETGVFNNGMVVRQDLPLLAERFEASGYDTRAVISLATLTPLKDGGLDRGFQDFDSDIEWAVRRPSF
jgi:arylsulfatase A-like enzyme